VELRAMPLSVDAAPIKHIEVIPWEQDAGAFGASYQTEDGISHCERIGTQAEAERIVRDVEAQTKSVLAEILPFPKDVAAS
jgi:hypothetical protein